VWDRPPTDAVVEALWNRAIAAQFATMRPQLVERLPENVTFRGRPIPALESADNTLYARAQDNALATDVLVHLKAPQVPVKLKALLEEVETAYARQAPNGAPQDVWMYMPTQESMRNAARLAEAYKPKEVVPVLYRIATGPMRQKASGQIGRQAYYWSNRTWALALTLAITRQSTQDWNLREQANLSGMWVLPAEADEKAALAMLREWWAKDHATWGGQADTRPEPPDNMPAEGGGVIIQPLR